MENNYTVYMHISPSGKRYIGITSMKPEKRWKNGKGYLKNKHFTNAIEKYGWDNFEHIIVAEGLTEKEAGELEIELIAKYDTTNSEKGYNHSLGGESGKHSEESKRLMSEARKGRVITKEWMDKILETRKLKGIGVGESNPMYGKKGKDNPVSKSIIMIDLEGNIVKKFECIREANDYFNKDRAFSLISKVCISGGTAYGYLWLFEEEYDKLINENKFNEWYLDTKNRYIDRSIKSNINKAQNNSKVVYQLNKDTLEIINEFNSIVLASESTNIPSKSISRVCRHGCNTAGGYSWIFAEEYEEISIEELKFLYCNKTTTEDVKKRMSENKKGKYLGKNNKNSKSVICLTTKKIFLCIREGAEYYNLKGTHISKCCRGKIKSHGEYNGKRLVWKYLVWQHDRRLRVINK